MKIKTKRGARRIRNQRVIDRRFVVTDYEDCSYITAGKLYRVINTEGQILPKVKDDDGDSIFVYDVGKTAAHLDYIGTWYHPIR